MKGTNKLLGAILLIAGTSIGAGMLALPVTTASYGFIPATILFFITWLATLFAALMMLEVSLWLPAGTNIISMAEETLGKWGKFFSWLSYLLLLYALLSAYITAINAFTISQVADTLHVELKNWQGATVITLIMGLLIFSGTKVIDYFNRVLILGLVVSYFGFVFSALPEIKISHLKYANYHEMWFALPIIVTSFGYQIIIPTLRRYLSGDIPSLIRAVVIGSTVPLLAYIIWELFVMGVVPTHGKYSLSWILGTGQPVVGLTDSLQHLIHKGYISTLASMIGFYVVATSFVGVSLSCYDFFRDALHTRKTPGGKFLAVLPTFIPPLIFALTYPKGFMMALGYGGALVAILLLILPAVMTYSGRYIGKEETHFQTPGGKTAIALVVLFGVAVILFEFIGNGGT